MWHLWFLKISNIGSKNKYTKMKHSVSTPSNIFNTTRETNFILSLLLPEYVESSSSFHQEVLKLFLSEIYFKKSNTQGNGNEKYFRKLKMMCPKHSTEKTRTLSRELMQSEGRFSTSSLEAESHKKLNKREIHWNFCCLGLGDILVGEDVCSASIETWV